MAGSRGRSRTGEAHFLKLGAHFADVFDLWAQWWRRRYAHGDVIIVRFADDFVMGFEYQQDVQLFLDELRERFAKLGLELHPDKTRLIGFGGLTWDDVDLDAAELTIGRQLQRVGGKLLHRETKTPASDATLPPPVCVAALQHRHAQFDVTMETTQEPAGIGS